ncbi:MAG: carbon-nitrogen hydrolase family protein [Planctomycetaceae bacterium]|nr:carbon-nitrogen hydrolase family protein [Planctomycetaceae bacterium]
MQNQWNPCRGFRGRLLTAILAALICSTTVRSEQPTGEPAARRPDRVKVAAVQITGYTKCFEPRAGYDPAAAIVEYTRKAAADGAQLVVFPEYHLGRIQVPSSVTESIARAAAECKVYVIVGCWELLDGDEFANAALLFGRDGRIVGKYYKTHAAVDRYEGETAYSRPPAGRDRQWLIENDPEWVMKRGDGFPVFDLDIGKVGIATCYDGYFPETFRILALNGAEIIVWINGRHGRIQDFVVRTAMFHNDVCMICTNQAYGAGTMIVQWPTSILAECPEAKEDYIAATLDLGRVRAAQDRSRNAQQRRPEIYGRLVEAK